MISKVKDNLSTGLMRVKWIAGIVAQRTKAETTSVKLLYESSKLENKIDDLHRDIGKRVLELREKGQETVFEDFIIKQALDEVKHLRETVDDYRKQAKELNKLPEL
jgi:hypothetical protein